MRRAYAFDGRMCFIRDRCAECAEEHRGTVFNFDDDEEMNEVIAALNESRDVHVTLHMDLNLWGLEACRACLLMECGSCRPPMLPRLTARDGRTSARWRKTRWC
jgi:hypothetical protein